jgi:UDPglucose 6-dehydrogenase
MANKTGLNIQIVGFGVVGSATATGLHEFGNEIYVKEPRPVSDLVGWNNSFHYTDNRYAFDKTDITMICLPTPADYERIGGRIDTRLFDTEIKQIGEELANHDRYHVFVVRSTVLPGTTRKYGQILEKISGKKLGKDFGIVMNPEFLRAFNAKHDFINAPVTILGSYDKKSGETVAKAYERSGIEIAIIGLEAAEFLKYFNNIWNAMKISAFNEFSEVMKHFECTTSECNYSDVADLMLKLTEGLKNPKYGTVAGLPYGGTCLPKDTVALHSFLEKSGFHPHMLEATIRMNEYMKNHPNEEVVNDPYFQARQHETYNNLKIAKPTPKIIQK